MKFNFKFGFLALFISMVFVAFFGSSALAQFQQPQFLFKWGSAGTGDDQFGPQYTWGITKDSSGNIYIADTENHRVQKFTSDGAYITQWGQYGSDDGQFTYPTAIAVDKSGNVFVSEWGDNWRIQKFTSEGVFIAKWGSYGSGDGQFFGPRGIAISNSGTVYVSDHFNHRIQKFTNNGIYLGQWGSYGSENGQFGRINGITIDNSDNVYACDHFNHRIQKFNGDGMYLGQWGHYGQGDGEFYFLTDIKLDELNNIYVVDQYNHRVQKFTGDGVFVIKWGSYGTEDGEFNYPTGIVMGNSDNVYVIDGWNSRVQVFGIETPVSAIENLVSTVEEMNLAHGIENSLDVKLQNAIDALNAAGSGYVAYTISKLQAFINECQAQSGKKLTIVQANQLIAEANRIMTILQAS